MARQILIPLKGDDRVEEILPYIQQVTQPGMEVVFLTPYHMDRRMIGYRGDLKSCSRTADIDNSEIYWWRYLSTPMESERRARLAEGLPSMYSSENRRSAPEERFFPSNEYSWENQNAYIKKLFSHCASLCGQKGVRSA